MAAVLANGLEADRTLVHPDLDFGFLAGDAVHGTTNRGLEREYSMRGRARFRSRLTGRGLSLLPITGGVAQMVRARGSYPRRPGFESLHRYHFRRRANFLP